MAEPLQFQDNTTTPRPSYLWFWDFGDPASGASNTSGAQNPTHTFSSPGTYDVNFYNITTPGCISNTKQKQITVAPIPSASITGNTTVCINTSPEPQIIFTASDGKALILSPIILMADQTRLYQLRVSTHLLLLMCQPM